jgi:very-short-patch-repair endonuclease
MSITKQNKTKQNKTKRIPPKQKPNNNYNNKQNKTKNQKKPLWWELKDSLLYEENIRIQRPVPYYRINFISLDS